MCRERALVLLASVQTGAPSKSSLELAQTTAGPWEQRRGRGLLKTELERPPLFPLVGAGLPSSALTGASSGWSRGTGGKSHPSGSHPADRGTEAPRGKEPGARPDALTVAGSAPALTEQRGKGKEGQEGLRDRWDWATWSEGVGLWPGRVAGLPARAYAGRGQQGSGWRAVDPAQQ